MENYRLSHPEIYRKVMNCDLDYIVSNWGRVFRVVDGRMVELLLQGGGKYAYLRMGGKSHRVLVGYIVARAFINNTRLCENVRHKDGNAGNNAVDNLEWCEFKEKMCKAKDSVVRVRGVVAYDKVTGEFVKRYESVSEASRQTDIARTRITDALNGRRESTGGFIWRYEI